MQLGATIVRGGARRASSLVGRTLNAALHPLQSELSAVLEYASSIAFWTVKFWAAVFVALGWLMCLACSSAITYLLFYSWIIPQYSCQLPVHFDVSTPLVNPHATVQLQGERQWRYSESTSLEGVEQSKRSEHETRNLWLHRAPRCDSAVMCSLAALVLPCLCSLSRVSVAICPPVISTTPISI